MLYRIAKPVPTVLTANTVPNCKIPPDLAVPFGRVPDGIIAPAGLAPPRELDPAGLLIEAKKVQRRSNLYAFIC